MPQSYPFSVLREPNPLLGNWCDRQRFGEDSFEQLLRRYTNYHVDLHRRVLPSFDEPSFLDMYLTQPPVRQIRLHYCTQEPSKHNWLVTTMEYLSPRRIWNENGVKVRDVIDFISAEAIPILRVTGFAFEVEAVTLMNEEQRRMVDQGFKNFAKLEGKIGRKNALRINAKRSHPANELNYLLEGDNLDKIVANNQVEDLIKGRHVFMLLHFPPTLRGLQHIPFED